MQSSKKEWSNIIKQQMNKIRGKEQQEDDIEIQIISEPKFSIAKEKPGDAISFWMNRVKHRNKQRTIVIDQGKDQIGNSIHAPKIGALPQKAAIPIVSHKKQREINEKTQVINVQQQSAKKNAEQYKKTIFRLGEQKKTQAASKPIYVESQQEKRRRFQRQVEIIDNINTPRWVIQKQKRNERNKEKYPLSNTYEYDHSKKQHFPKQLQKFNDYTWYEFQRNQQEMKKKKKEKKEQQRKIEQEKQRELDKKRKLEKDASYQEFFSNLLGLQPKKKQKTQQNTLEMKGSDQTNDITKTRLEKMEIVQQINALQNQSEQLQNIEYVQKIARQNRFGIRDIVKAYQTNAPHFINIILQHDFSQQHVNMQTKKIPDIFEQKNTYKKVFHYLITNQCIADVSQRLRAIQKGKSETKIKININNLRANNEGLTEILIKEIINDEKGFTLKSHSLSRYRIGLITSQQDYKRQNYGVPSKKEGVFGFLVLLVTPETKEELGPQVKAICCAKVNQLQWIIKKRKSSQTHYYDLQNLSTHVRQYIAVSNLPYSDLSPAVLDPRIISNEMNFVQNKQLLKSVLQNLGNIFNQTQFESIREMVIRQKGFVLLQGPPGTGKTSTLMGLLSAQYEYLKQIGDNRKIMICAPSNAAVNHIAKRLQVEGLINGEGQIFRPNVLRIGILQSLDPDIRAVYLDDLCQKELNRQEEMAKKEGKMTTPQIKERIIQLQKQIRLLGNRNQKELNEKKQQILKFQSMLYTFRKQKMVTSRKNYLQIESQYLASCQIILTTLSSSGNDKVDRLRGQIACLIVDQAAQATQTNLLIALQTGVQKVLLIGDPYQLPATCMSSDCNVTLFNRSLFQRFLDAGIKPYFLNIQYRMAPMIRYFPSYKFYQGRLIDSDSIVQRPVPQFLEQFNNRSVIFIDIKYGRQEKKGDSQVNYEQGKVIGLLIRCLLEPSVSMGVITPYQAQRKVIIRECNHQLKNNKEQIELVQKSVMINTVDSFQGQQKDIIIVSTVRANNRQNLGFLTDQRRINVTLTRSKFVLIVVGHGDTLGANEVWNQFLDWAECNKVYYEIKNKEEVKTVMKDVLQIFNNNPIQRRRYDNLSTDIRKIQRKQIQSNDFKIKKSEQSKNTNPQNHQNVQFNKITKDTIAKTTENQYNPKQSSNKYARDIHQSKEIIQQKRKRQKQAEQFQQMQNRIRMLEEQYSKNGNDIFG